MTRTIKSARFSSLLALCLAGGASAAAPAPAGGAADLILTNARVYTVEKGQPWAEAVAIRDGRILAVGSAAAIARKKGRKTRIVDLKGRLLLPAFGDAHNHPIFGGLSFARCSLHEGKTVEDYRRIISKCIADTPGNSVINGTGWEDSLFPPNGVPRKEILDALSKDRALVFRSIGGHSLWLNSKALELAHITKDTPDPPNGHIDRDPATGEPVGGLQEAARDLGYKLVPPPGPADLQQAIAYTARLFNSLGITSWNDADIEWNADGSSPAIEAYRAVRDRGDLTVRVTLDLKWDNGRGLDQIPTLLKVSRHAAELGFPARTIKYFLDGVIPQQTAAMIEPYEGTSEKGATQIPPRMLADAIASFDAKGFQAHIHAIGDGAVREALDAFAETRRRNGMSDTRPMISHMNVVDPADQPRFGKLGVNAIFQPLWACNEPYMLLTKERIGPRRSQYIYPENGIRKAGGRLAYGADWSVASANPLEGIQVALTRICPGVADREPLLPGEAVTLEQAIEAYTINVAYVNHFEKDLGSIAPGKSADLVVLDRDLFKIPASEISHAHVLVTLQRGREVHGRLDRLAAALATTNPAALDLAKADDPH